jgi:hypothetical protein
MHFIKGLFWFSNFRAANYKLRRLFITVPYDFFPTGFMCFCDYRGQCQARGPTLTGVLPKLVGVEGWGVMWVRSSWLWVRSSWVVRVSDSQCRLSGSVLGSIPASSDTVESEGRQMKQCWISYIKRKYPKIPPPMICTSTAVESAMWRAALFGAAQRNCQLQLLVPLHLYSTIRHDSKSRIKRQVRNRVFPCHISSVTTVSSMLASFCDNDHGGATN